MSNVSYIYNIFFNSNPQLKCVKVVTAKSTSRNDFHELQEYRKIYHFPNIPKNFGQNTVDVSEKCVHGIFDCVSIIKTLRVIKIRVHDENKTDKNTQEFIGPDASFVEMGEALPHLEMFSSQFLTFKEQTICAFVEKNIRLKVLHLHWTILNLLMQWCVVLQMQWNAAPKIHRMPANCSYSLIKLMLLI